MKRKKEMGHLDSSKILCMSLTPIVKKRVVTQVLGLLYSLGARHRKKLGPLQSGDSQRLKEFSTA